MAASSEANNTKRERLEQSIAALEAQRAILGDEATDAAVSSIRREISAIKEAESKHKNRKEGERRIVTVLFCDVAGSTALAEQMDPEDWTGIMNAAFEQLIASVERFGGTVARLMGDAILAFFGAPSAHEDDPRRAVMAGLAILNSIRPLREKVQSEKGVVFDVRVGINTGLAVVGDVGSDLVGEYTAMGDAVNLAARMEQSARPGTVQIAEGTYRLVAPYFEFRPIGSVAVKGKREPVKAFQVLGEAIQPGPARGLEAHGIHSPLVGREAELSAAKNAIVRLHKGHGSILMIFGDAGIGKSRLVAELFQQSVSSVSEPSQHETQWLEGRAQSFGKTISFWPLLEILREYAGITEEDSDKEAWVKLETAVQDLFREKTAEVLPYLAVALSLEVPGAYVERVKYLDAKAMGDQITIAFLALFQELSTRKPLVLVFEDLHWVDESSARLLGRLLPLVETVPLLILGLSRPLPGSPAMQLGEQAAADQALHYTELSLAPLSAGDSNRLVHNLLEIDDLPHTMRETIVRKADGNPFFLEEVLRNLIESGSAVRNPSTGRWQAAAQIGLLAIPDTVQGVIMARVDRLDGTVKAVVQAAAVVGRTFLYRVLKRVLTETDALDSHLAELTSVELIREKERLPELEYIFRHALARDAIYESILLQRRRGLHARVGKVIEATFADRLEEFYGLLAHHYTAAGDWEKAQYYLFQVGDQAQGMAADSEALAHYQQAITAYEQAFGEPMAPAQRGAVERKMGDAYFRLGRLDESWALSSSATALLDRAIPSAGLESATALAGQLLRQLMHRLWPQRFLGRIPEHKKKAAPEALLAYMRLGQMAFMRGVPVPVMLYIGLRSLNLAEMTGTPQDMVRGYCITAIGAGGAGSLKLADYYMGLAREADRKHDDASAHALFLSFWGGNRLGGCRWDQAVEVLESAADLNRRIGSDVDRELDLHNLAFVLQKTGVPDKVSALRNEVMASAERREDSQMIIWTLFYMAEDCLRSGGPGHVEETRSLLDQAQGLLASHPSRGDEVLAQCLSAQTSYRAGHLAAARQGAETALRLLNTERPQLLPYFADAQAALPMVALSLWEGAGGADGKDLAEESVKFFRGQAKATTAYLLPRASLYQGLYDWLSGRRRQAESAWARCLALAEQYGMPYDQGLAHFEMGRHLPPGDSAREGHLRKAADLFSQVGSVWNLTLVRQLLDQD
jgi:class 3 adenylate cyclase/tetratricopeptide (TPR) repeat protein